MHKLEYPPAILERIVHRRGRLHVYDRITARRAALLVVDMQRAYLNPPARIPGLEAVVPTIERLAHEMRTRDGTVVWIKNTLAGDGVPPWPAYDSLRDAAFLEATRSALTEGDPRHGLLDGLHVREGDIVEKKYRYSAFTAESPRIEAALRERDIEIVIVAGTVTNVCCETTVRDAMMKNFGAIMVADANVARTDEEHMQSLLNVWQFFGDVMTADEIIERLV